MYKDVYEILVKGRVMHNPQLWTTTSNGKEYLRWIIHHRTTLSRDDNGKPNYRFEPIVCSFYGSQRQMESLQRRLPEGSIVVLKGEGRPPYINEKKDDNDNVISREAQASILVKEIYSVTMFGPPQRQETEPEVETVDNENSDNPPF